MFNFTSTKNKENVEYKKNDLHTNYLKILNWDSKNFKNLKSLTHCSLWKGDNQYIY